MSNAQRPSAMPMDPYQWRESVLSTRSLSYLSTADVFGSPDLTTRSQNGSLTYAQYRMRRDSDSDYDLEMGGTGQGRRLSDRPELPDSVVRSALFTLPRELRDRIYSFCMTARNGYPVEWPPLPNNGMTYALQPQLLRTCSIIHDEAAPLLYSLNNMTFHHPSDANMFVRTLASTALSRRHIVTLSLHIKAADTRLWMPYLTSTNPYRSLKTDFPYLRDLQVRYRSSKWNHTLSPDQNLMNWSEDNRLDEIIDGLRHIFYPPQQPPVSRDERSDGVKPLNEMTSEEFMRFVDAKKPGEDMAFKRQLLELHRAHAPAARQPDLPTIRVVCACRVHSAHFGTITAADTPTSAQSNHRGSLAAALHLPNSTSENQAITEGSPFKGFTVSDFRTTGSVQKIHEPDLGTAKIARTPFADKDRILIALEIHTLSPTKDVQAEQRA